MASQTVRVIAKITAQPDKVADLKAPALLAKPPEIRNYSIVR